MGKILFAQDKINKDFQLEIIKFINNKNLGKNIMISPLSIYHILSLTSNGAANTTMVEMLQLLGHKNKIDLNKTNSEISKAISNLKSVKIANAIFTKFKPESAFMKLIEGYKSTIDELISANQVNSWCSKATNNTINKIVDDINDVLMILINAIYFKGNWEKKFDAKLTDKLPFYNFNKEEKITDFMHMNNNFDYFEDENAQAIQINYNEDNLKALIILPKTEKDINNYIKNFNKKIYENIKALIILPKGEKDINNYIKNFNKEIYENIIKGLFNQKIDLSLPKFEIKYEEELNEILMSMGMKEAFGSADFSIMKKEKDIHISKVIHKTFIKVDEEGTVAAAVTAVVMKARMKMMIRVNRMMVNHPFVFIIRSHNLPLEHDILFFTKVEAL